MFAVDNAKFVPRSETRLAGVPQDSVLLDRTLLIQGAGVLELWDLANPAAPRSIPSVDHGCVWFDLQQATGSPEVGWWAPGGDYGAPPGRRRVPPRGLPEAGSRGNDRIVLIFEP